MDGQRTNKKPPSSFWRKILFPCPSTVPIWRIAAAIRRETKLKFPDAAIAATALFTHTPVAYRNQRDFKKVSGLKL